MDKSAILKRIQWNVDRLSDSGDKRFRHIPFHRKGTPSVERVQEVWLYLPGAETKDLPEGFLSWTTSAFAGEVPEELPFYGLYNVNEETGFVGCSGEETPGWSG